MERLEAGADAGRGSYDAIHDVDLQTVQVGQVDVTLGTDVLRNVHLLLPVSAIATYRGGEPTRTKTDKDTQSQTNTRTETTVVTCS